MGKDRKDTEKNALYKKTNPSYYNERFPKVKVTCPYCLETFKFQIEPTKHIAKFLSFCLGNVVKYVCRFKSKPCDDPILDLEKAKWYLDCEIDTQRSLKND